MIKQVIDGLVADEQELWTAFNEQVGPADRVFRTDSGYVIVGKDDDAPEGAEAIGRVGEWYDA